jgi:hypothetical protein
MAVETIQSQLIIDREAGVKTNPRVDNGDLKRKYATVAVPDASSIGSTFRMFQLSSSDTVEALILSCSAITSAAADVGLRRTLDDGGAVVDADFFASAQSVATAQAALNITHESGEYPHTRKGMPIWQALNLTADPYLKYDVVVTFTAAATASGTLSLSCLYVDGF